MRHRSTGTAMLAALALLAVPQAAGAAVDVTSDGAGGVLVTGGDAAESVVLDRASTGRLRVVDTSGTPVTSSDATCSADVEQPTAVTCAVDAVSVALGAAGDTFDSTALTGSVTLTVSGGDGADTLRVGSPGTTTLTDVTLTDTIDLSSATSGITARYQASPVFRVVATCGGCAPAWTVRLPAGPGRVVLGPMDDRVELNAWRSYGRTTWVMGDGLDRFFGSPTRRSTVNAGLGNDQLVSRAAADTFNAGEGSDKLADLGGAGDILRAGPGVDTMASLDSRRDTVDGQGGRDMCLSRNRSTSGCDTGGPVRGIENPTYFPVTTQKMIFQAIGIRG